MSTMSWMTEHTDEENCYFTTVGRRIARAVVDPAERRRVGELMGAKYPWDGDPSVGLTFDAWCFDVPAFAIESWSVAGE